MCKLSLMMNSTCFFKIFLVLGRDLRTMIYSVNETVTDVKSLVIEISEIIFFLHFVGFIEVSKTVQGHCDATGFKTPKVKFPSFSLLRSSFNVGKTFPQSESTNNKSF